MSIFKDTFKEGVQNQLKARERAIFERTPAAIQYFNGRNSWIRMTSAVNVGIDDGTLTPGKSDLAKSYVLLGGTLYDGKLRSGVGTGSQAYSPNSITTKPDGSIKSEPNRLGIRPMPGITSIDVKSKSAYGSLREVVVNFQCWDIRQLEELELLYMRPGYTVLVEWGWSSYLDNNGNLKTDVSFVEDVLNGGISKEQIWKNVFEKASKNGNYDGHYGFVKNYSWSARPDGGYDCTSTIISMGEILESLKINYVPADSPIAKSGVFGTAEIFAKMDNLTSGYFGINPLYLFSEEQGSIQKSYSQNIIAGICNELYRLLQDELDEFEERTFTSNKWTFYRFDLDVSNAPLNEDSDFTDKEQIYILLKDFIDILNKYVVLKDTKGQTPVMKISVNEGAHMGGEDKPLLCLGHPLQLSTNPTICLIKNDAWLNPANFGFEEGFFDDFDTLTKKIENLKTNYWYNDSFVYDDNNPTPQLGIIGNIYVNLGYIYSLVTDPNLEAQDKKEKNDIILFDFLKSMMAGISTSIGNVATFDIFSDPIDSTARIIDINYTDPNPRKNTWENAFTFELQNTKSIIRNYRFESQIFPDQTTIVAIGAQAKGGALGADVNTLIDFNQNLFDRIIPKKDAPYNNNTTDPKQEEEEKVKNIKENTKIIVDFINEIDPTLFGTGDYDINNASKYNNALKDLINYTKSTVSNDNTNRAIIPTKLSIETDGIGGIVIGNLFKIPNDLLPRGYKGGGAGPAKIAYAVTGLGHSIQNNDWKTTIDAQFIILDDPRGGMSLVKLKDIKTTIKSAQDKSIFDKAKDFIEGIINTGTPEEGTGGSIPVGSPPKDASALGFGLPINKPYSIASPLNRASEKRYNVPVAGNIKHQGIDTTGPNRGEKDKNLSKQFGGKGTNGDPIFSVQDGKVIVAGPVSGYGYAIYIEHNINGEKYTSIYGHVPLKSITVKVGQTVKKGATIAYMGTEGKSDGFHLHFELWKGSKPKGTVLDPLDYLPYFKSNGGDIPDNTAITKGFRFPKK